ncbi:MAG: DUF488 domain-containing protein [Gammaproteobacteria bacterium]
MTAHIVRLGTPRRPHEGLRIGTVLRPPRGVKREDFARLDYYDVWLPILAPRKDTVRLGLDAGTAAEWQRFRRRYLAEMRRPEPSRTLDLLAALSHQTDFAVGCYCEQESRCHRALLRELLAGRGAAMAPG